jgi:hypothetical protein
MPKVPHIPSNIPGVAGEKVLIVAILRQAMSDLESTNLDEHRLAYAFLSDTRRVFEFTEVIGLDQGAVARHLAIVLAERLTGFS